MNAPSLLDSAVARCAHMCSGSDDNSNKVSPERERAEAPTAHFSKSLHTSDSAQMRRFAIKGQIIVFHLREKS